ncbi:hypothetical protein [uncultured Ilyobacter sp.]|uniref:hypothetical protein n=1 Tax=uncultured Ilyobacter sp. TaxID=544433 RepID=UPI0029C6CC38|nr:hypothetical protein [uncultured Ilyobacter sp.]
MLSKGFRKIVDLKFLEIFIASGSLSFISKEIYNLGIEDARIHYEDLMRWISNNMR